MSLIYKLYKYLNKIKTKELTISKIIKDESGNKDAEMLKKSLKYLANRYYRLSWEANNSINDVQEEIKEYFICTLAISYSNKELDESYFKEAFNQDETEFESFNKELLLNALLNLKSNPLKYEGKDVIKKLSINYSYPEWVIKMMVKHFGVSHIYKDVVSIKKPLKMSLNVNTLLTSKEEVLKDNRFTNIDYLENGIRYEGDFKLNEITKFKNNEIFIQDEVSQLLISKLNLEMGDETLLISEDNGPLAIDMAIKQNDIGNIHVINTDMLTISSVRKFIDRFKLKSVNVIQTDLSLLLSHVAKESLDKILFIAPSSNLGLLRRKSSLLLTLKREDLDSLITYQKTYLEDVASHLKQGGRMIYAVYTYNKKESSLIVSEFLNNNPDYTLIEEKQLFTYTLPSDGAYYAIIERKQND